MGKISIAILDMNDGMPNEGMRCIRSILAAQQNHYPNRISIQEFEVRKSVQIPTVDHDVFISSGGPGSPLESEGTEWENAYFKWIALVDQWNNEPLNTRKKFIFFICHSFQMACRYFQIGEVIRRKSTAFGVFPIHMLHALSNTDPIFAGLNDPFYGVDSRDFQVVHTNNKKIQEAGGEILCIEKERPHVPLERAVMAIRFNTYMVGTQFHPEADAQGMSMYLQREDKKNTVIENHGFNKWASMLEHLNDPDKIELTSKVILPNFIAQAIEALDTPSANTLN
ncbi:MAG: type 1 glutamine amidotransferase [Bacteroidota bacterium]